ncbi:chemokine-like receptor 1 isoform X1 [Polypterus senegalus]|uniref:chemokine-like receptor 1 isoform X1 n=1 Tax=Polypterus senegalus TaxID=55291 RepID=UPI0019669EBE|nr:chemokine-like receptor 1 isoform X1 [Polypterus senegalus]
MGQESEHRPPLVPSPLNSSRSAPYTEAEEVMHVVAAVVYSLVFLLGTIGNGLIIWLTGFRMIRTVNTIWFLNLAIADFIFAALRPFAVVREALSSDWPFGSTMCKMNDFVKYLNMYASVFILTTISIDRCMLVVHPVWSRNHRSIRMASLVALFTWVIAFFFSMPYLFLRDTMIDLHNKTKCTLSFTGDAEEKRRVRLATYITRFTCGFLVPFGIITTCYVIIYLRIKDKKWSRSNRPFIIIMVTIAAFFVCWMPYHIFNFLKTSSLPKAFVKVGYRISSGLAYLNSCLNPIFYFFVGYSFRKVGEGSLLASMKNVFMDDPNQAKLSITSSESIQLPLRKMTITVANNNNRHPSGLAAN